MRAEAQDTAEARESSQAFSLFALNLVVGPEVEGMQEGLAPGGSEPVSNAAGPAAVVDTDPVELSAEVPMSGISCFMYLLWRNPLCPSANRITNEEGGKLCLLATPPQSPLSCPIYLPNDSSHRHGHQQKTGH